MAKRPAGPYLLDIPYTIQGVLHHLTFNCDAVGSPAVGTPPSGVTMESKDGNGVLLNGAVDAFWTAVRPIFSTTTLASAWTLWKMNANNNDKLFISGGTLTTPNGGNAAAPILTSQVTLTWRTGGGNVTKLIFLETPLSANLSYPLTESPFGEPDAISAWVLSGGSIMLGRDRAFPVQAMTASFDPQNDKVFERRYRS